jgi:hypothetical protein
LRGEIVISPPLPRRAAKAITLFFERQRLFLLRFLAYLSALYLFLAKHSSVSRALLSQMMNE